ncbi:hypothetical protein [Oleisolibacter albus]|uniref:hypothetical protein n=1 Tax=Oleisolibacter albus TaxID=2171757 RepID=UPI000DF22062|nr:hypothetical protein [Oleisolibacter albus]
MPLPPNPIRIRSLADGRAALAVARELGCPLVLVSDPGAAGFAGPGWWAALESALDTAADGHPLVALLDCADNPGHVLAAIRAGVRDIAFAGPADVGARLADIAAQAGSRLHPPVAGALDLRGGASPAALRAWLARPAPPKD